jgi:hypothetical protein
MAADPDYGLEQLRSTWTNLLEDIAGQNMWQDLTSYRFERVGFIFPRELYQN